MVQIAAAMYQSNPRWIEMTKQIPLPPQIALIQREIEISWDIATRALHLLRVDPQTIELLQVVRYTTLDAQYKVDHDHGGFYGLQK